MRYLCFFKRSRKTLRGFLIAAWAGAKITERSEQRQIVIFSEKSFILSLKNLSVLYAVLYYSLSILLVSLTFKLHRNFLNISFFYKFKCNWI